MAVSSQRGSLGFALQTAKGSKATADKWIRATEISLGPVQDATPLPPEIGGQRGTSGVTKLGIRSGGGFTTIVRAQYVPYFLYALCGSKSVVATGAGSYKHTITPSDNEVWMTLTKNVSDLWAEEHVDCKIGRMVWDIPARGQSTMAFEVSGIEPTVVSAPTETAWDTTEHLVSGAGVVTQDGSPFKCTRVRIEIDNQPDNAQWIIGQYTLDDIDFMGLPVTITFDKHVQDATLYQNVYYNGGTSFSAVPYTASFSVQTASPGNISGETFPYSIQFTMPSVIWTEFNPTLRGNDIVVTTCTGMGILPAAGNYFQFDCINQLSSIS